MSEPRFGPAGLSDSYTVKKFDPQAIAAHTAARGLTAFEYQCGRGVRLAADKADALGKAFAEQGILPSVHAPYYISMSSLEEDKRLHSIDYLLQSCALVKQLGGRRVVLYTSDLRRARQTAECIANRLGAMPVVRTELRERNLGRCCGKSMQWLRENRECEERTVDDRLFSDAESRRDEWNRLKPFFEQVMAEEVENIIIVSHGDLLSVFNAMFLGLDVEALNAYELFGLAGGVSQMMVRDDGKRVIKRISDMSYVR